MRRPALQQIEEETSLLTPGLAQEALASAVAEVSADAGAALATARAQDKAWRAERNATMQHRLDRADRLEKLGQRMRGWAWGCLWGAAALGAFLPLAWQLRANPALEVPLTAIVLGSVGAFLLGGVLGLLSKALRITSGLWRKRLLRQADRDHLELWESLRDVERAVQLQAGIDRAHQLTLFGVRAWWGGWLLVVGGVFFSVVGELRNHSGMALLGLPLTGLVTVACGIGMQRLGVLLQRRLLDRGAREQLPSEDPAPVLESGDSP